MKARPPFYILLAAAASLTADLRAAPMASPTPSPAPSLPTDEQVTAILRQRIDVDKRGVSIVVGLIDEKGSRVVAYGHPSIGSNAAVDGKTFYEIGSVTKTFTDLVFADAVLKGEVKLDDPVAKYLPAEAHVPSRHGREITLLDLATHRSGLPRMPDVSHPGNPADPMADYQPAQLYAFLSGYELKRDPGSEMEYSNLGVGLLGHALALRENLSYEQLVKNRVCYVLDMRETGITMSSTMRPRMAQPYDRSLTRVSNTNIATISGAGALRSTMNDMLKFLSAELGLTPSPLSAAMQETQKVRSSAKRPDTDVALGWFTDKTNDPMFLWHNGSTSGYHSFVAICPTNKTGVVVLANSANDIDDIGCHLLDDRRPLKAQPKIRTPVTLAPEIADRYMGRYQVTPRFILTITRDRDHYFVAASDQPRNEFFPESETEFFSKLFDGQITFVKDADGQWTSLILHQAGIPDQTATRLPATEDKPINPAP